MRLLLVITTLCLADWVCARNCPPKYKRFSMFHLGCASDSEMCYSSRTERSFEEKQEILDAHNAIRSRVAMGLETGGSRLPEASNMMQMEWDDELAQLAQIEVDRCGHTDSCRTCRMVENFAVGRVRNIINIKCEDRFICKGTKPSWTDMVQRFYRDIIPIYNSNAIDNYEESYTVDPFTQVIWANSWRVGCGYRKVEADKYAAFVGHDYVCYYGPAGNIKGSPVYRKGKPCSNCPSNACCGKNCSPPNFDGLCKMLSTDTYPFYPDKYAFDDLIFYCDFDDLNEACDAAEGETRKWEIKKTLMGNIKSIRLSARQKNGLLFKKLIKPKRNFCIQIRLRESLANDGEGEDYSNIMVVINSKDGKKFENIVAWENDFFTKTIDVPYYRDAMLYIEFSIPKRDAPDAILDIKDIVIFNGNCSERNETQLGYP